MDLAATRVYQVHPGNWRQVRQRSGHFDWEGDRRCSTIVILRNRTPH